MVDHHKMDGHFYYMKKTMQVLLVLPVSLLPFYFLAYPSAGGTFSFFFSFNIRFSTIVFQLLGRTLERKYMFLICNGILAFLAKTSGFIGSSSASPTMSLSNSTELPVMKNNIEDRVIKPVESSSSSSSSHEVDEAIITAKVVEIIQEEEEKREKYTAVSIMCDEEEEDIQGEDEAEEEEDGYLLGEGAQGNEVNLMNTEELNMKIEEFIRKMKEEIKIEALRQPISV